MVTFVVSATDIVDVSDPVVCVPPSGSTFPLGTTLVQCTATDAHNNSSHGSFSVTVQDTTPPQVISIVATPSFIWPPDHKMVEVNILVSAFDLVDPNPVSRIVSVTTNQEGMGPGNGNPSADWQILGPLKLLLRAERVQDDRVYFITVQTTDFSGNSISKQVSVPVARTRGHPSH
jgi:hypothetical protein